MWTLLKNDVLTGFASVFLLELQKVAFVVDYLTHLPAGRIAQAIGYVHAYRRPLIGHLFMGLICGKKNAYMFSQIPERIFKLFLDLSQWKGIENKTKPKNLIYIFAFVDGRSEGKNNV